MKLFLTSSMGGCIKDNGIRIPCQFDNSNNFLNMLKNSIPVSPKCLIISSDPECIEINDSVKSLFIESFRLSEISLNKIEICDVRNEISIKDMIYDYDLIILAGGHVPTQNNFFNRIKLKELLKKYKGVIVGISAGSMNCSSIVYAQPELDGEAIDINFKRYLDGLDLTSIIILPHFQNINDFLVDGLRPIEDISLPDSYIRPFYALVDGSFILIEDEKSTLYGEAYYLENGVCKKICELNHSIEL